MRNRFLVFLSIFSLCILSFDIVKPVKWTFLPSPSKPEIGSTVDLIFSGKIDKDWYLYSSELKVEGPSPTEVQFINNGSFRVIGKLIAVNPKEKYDEIWGGKVNYFIKEAKFIQKIKILKAGAVVEGKLINQACTLKDGSCVTNKDKFSFKF